MDAEMKSSGVHVSQLMLTKSALPAAIELAESATQIFATI